MATRVAGESGTGLPVESSTFTKFDGVGEARKRERADTVFRWGCRCRTMQAKEVKELQYTILFQRLQVTPNLAIEVL